MTASSRLDKGESAYLLKGSLVIAFRRVIDRVSDFRRRSKGYGVRLSQLWRQRVLHVGPNQRLRGQTGQGRIR
jgi:hypothetical protein